MWVRSIKSKDYRGNFGRYLFDMFLEDDEGNIISVSDLMRDKGFEKKDK